MLQDRSKLTRYAWLSIGAAVLTILLKGSAYWLTNSVGLLSDALESLVNLAAATVALIMLSIASRPPDQDHAYGHDKAEYFSSGVEGGLILLAACSIIWTSVERLLNPQPIGQTFVGLAITALATLINLSVGLLLIRTGKRENSIALEADGHHLLTDVWTSLGVIAGVIAIIFTQWFWLDAVIALLVAANIIWQGIQLVRRSALGLLDTALPEDEIHALETILKRYCQKGVTYHALRTRRSGVRRFSSVHVLVPGHWTVQRGHSLLERIERDMHDALSNLVIVTHLEPVEDPRSFKDVKLDRDELVEEVV